MSEQDILKKIEEGKCLVEELKKWWGTEESDYLYQLPPWKEIEYRLDKMRLKLAKLRGE